MSSAAVLAKNVDKVDPGATFPAGDFKWGAYANNVTRPDVLSALSESGTLLVDVFIPETSPNLQHLGLFFLCLGQVLELAPYFCRRSVGESISNRVCQRLKSFTALGIRRTEL